MDFTNSYYHSRSIYLGLPGSVAVSAEGLKGKRVGVQDHTRRRSSSGVTGSTWLKSSVFLPMGN